MLTSKNNSTAEKIAEKHSDVAKAIECVAEELEVFYKIEDMNHSLNKIGGALYRLAQAQAVSVIATHGTEKDREWAVSYFKRWFEDR